MSRKLLVSFDYSESREVTPESRNQARRPARKRAGSVNSVWWRTPEKSHAPESQKLSQTYSRQRRVRRRRSRAASARLRHSADQPSSPAARAPNSRASRSSNDRLRGLP